MEPTRNRSNAEIDGIPAVAAPSLLDMKNAFAGNMSNVHTLTMTLRKAALLSLIGTALMTVLLVWAFVSNVINAMHGLVPGVRLFSSFIYAFGCFGVTVFFYVFYRGS